MSHVHKNSFNHMNNSETQDTLKRNPRYASQHDPIYASLDGIKNWFVYGHLSLNDSLQFSEAQRLKKFHLLIRDTAKRFVGHRDLNNLGWFLRQEGNGHSKRYHFHFALTADNLGQTTPQVVCRFLKGKWEKLARSECSIEPWDPAQTAKGIWYMTQLETYKVPHSTYFKGDVSHWRMSTLLHTKIRNSNQESNRP